MRGARRGRRRGQRRPVSGIPAAVRLELADVERRAAAYVDERIGELRAFVIAELAAVAAYARTHAEEGAALSAERSRRRGASIPDITPDERAELRRLWTTHELAILAIQSWMERHSREHATGR